MSGTLKGTLPGAAVTFGGAYGCDGGNYSPGVSLWEGGRFVFFMSNVTWSRPGSNAMAVTEAWIMGADGVHDPRTEDVWLTLEELGPYLFGPEPT